MARAAALATVVVLAGCGSSAPAAATTFPYTSADGRFSVVFPGKPSENVTEAADGGAKRRVSSTMAAKAGDDYGVTWSDFPTSFLGDGATALLEKVRDTVITGVKGTLVSSHETTVGTLPALDVVAKVASGATKGEYHARFVLAGTRIYEVLVIRNNAKADDERMLDFFDSFELTRS